MAKRLAGQEVLDEVTTAGITATPTLNPTVSSPNPTMTPTTNTNVVDGGSYSGGASSGTSGGSSGGDSGNTTSTEPNKNLYYDVINAAQSKPEYTAPEDKSTGSAAAKGTQYSWDQKGLSDAQNQYQQDVLQAKQDALANRQTIEQNALQYQQQADMMKYISNQEAEKVGWTGGYVLDQNRQMEYLKASIQAQMYGAMELQKYGYDSALSAARLSYDLNQKQFAHQYYQDAVNAALSEAQITGVYFSAETRDMMSQLAVAEQELGHYNDLSDKDIARKVALGEIKLTPEQQKALEVRRNINAWYKANDVSETGIKTLAAWETEQAYAQQWADSIWQKYTAAMESAEKKIDEDVNTFIKLDAEGNPIFDGLSVSTINFKNLSAEEIIQYANSTGADGKDQVQTYMGHSIESIVTTAGTAKSETLKSLIEQDEKLIKLADKYNGYEYTTQFENYSIKVNITADGTVTVTSTKVKTSNDSTSPDDNLYEIAQKAATKGNTDLSVSYTDIIDEYSALKEYTTFTVQSEAIGNSGDHDDDFDVDIGKYNYDLDVDWTYGGNQGLQLDEWNAATGYLNVTYNNIDADTFVIYNGGLWFYSTKMRKWGYVQQNTGGSSLFNDLKQASAGTVPTRWSNG